MNSAETNWHVLTLSRGGTVSLLKNLPREAALETVNLLKPKYARPWGTNTLGDIMKVDAFGPDGDEQIQGWGRAAGPIVFVE